MIGLEGDEGTGRLTPFFIGPGHHRRFQHRRVAIEHAFQFDGGNVLAPGNDDVLEPVADLHVAVRVGHPQVAGVEPAALEGFGGGRGVLQVALHHGVAAHEDLADGLAVPGRGFEGFRVGHHHPSRVG